MLVRKWLIGGVFLISLVPMHAFAQGSLVTDTVTMSRARVLEITDQKSEIIPGTDTSTQHQRVQAEILDGLEKGKSVTFDNDYAMLDVGETFYLRHSTNALDGTDQYAVSDPYRLNILGILAVVFLVLIVIFGGIQGVRGFMSLCGSCILIFYALIPGILHGYSPILVSIGVASLIIVLGSYITHGFNRTTSAAVFGMIGTVLITGIGAYWLMHAAHLTGYTSEEQVYLNFNTNGSIDMVGLLFGGIMIGLLGVLYDIAIGQAVAVEELMHAGRDLPRKHIYTRAIRIGREHIGALVNTLAIAYVGAALPLLLLVQNATYGLAFAVNSELFATEIIRILVGSIGLVLAVPITTLIAVNMLKGDEGTATSHGHSH